MSWNRLSLRISPMYLRSNSVMMSSSPFRNCSSRTVLSGTVFQIARLTEGRPPVITRWPSWRTGRPSANFEICKARSRSDA